MKNVFYPLSVIDFVKHTEKMQKEEFLFFADGLKLRLKSVLNTQLEDLHPMQYEIQHLIDFIRQVCFYLYYSKWPGMLEDCDEVFFRQVISRYPAE
jgi:hypothetical protein